MRYVPGFSVAGRTMKLWLKTSVVSPNAMPARNARRLASMICGLPENFSRIQSSVPSVGRENIHESSPSANMFFDRSISFCVSPSTPSREPRVSLLSGIS